MTSEVRISPAPPLTEQPPPSSVITWWMRYTVGGTLYQYAAIRVADHGWYTTSTKWRAPISWAELVTIIGDGPCAVAREFQVMHPAPRGLEVRQHAYTVPDELARTVERNVPPRPPEPDYTELLAASIERTSSLPPDYETRNAR